MTQETELHAARTRNTLIILSISVAIMVIVGLTVGIFLLVRSNDTLDVQNRIEDRVAQSEKALCAFMITREQIRNTPNDVLLANEAAILIKRFGCESKGTLTP